MELARYRPDQAIRWLKPPSVSIKSEAKTKKSGEGIANTMRTAAEALYDLGKGAYADALKSNAEANEYVLQANHLDIIKHGVIKTILYERITAIQVRQDRATLVLDNSTVTIKPFAYVQAGRIKVPIGWQRNGLDVPFELLFEEISARSGVPLTVPAS